MSLEMVFNGNCINYLFFELPFIQFFQGEAGDSCNEIRFNPWGHSKPDLSEVARRLPTFAWILLDIVPVA